MKDKNKTRKPLLKFKKGGSFGSFIGDAGRLIADNTLSVFGAGNVIQDDDYKNVDMRNISKVTGKIAGAAAPIAATAIGGPLAGMAVSKGQNIINNNLNPENTSTSANEWDQVGNTLGTAGSIAGSFMGGGGNAGNGFNTLNNEAMMMAKYGGRMPTYQGGGKTGSSYSERQNNIYRMNNVLQRAGKYGEEDFQVPAYAPQQIQDNFYSPTRQVPERFDTPSPTVNAPGYTEVMRKRDLMERIYKDQNSGNLKPRQDGDLGMQSDGSYKWGYGGKTGQPNAELEKREVMRYPNGSTDQVNGPSHEAGGVPVNLPQGTHIFSDKLKMPGMKHTFAKHAAKYKTDKEAKILSDKNANSLAKSSAELGMKIKNQKLSEIFEAQETLKQGKIDKYMKRMGGIQKFHNGGIGPGHPHLAAGPRATEQAPNAGFMFDEEVQTPEIAQNLDPLDPSSQVLRRAGAIETANDQAKKMQEAEDAEFHRYGRPEEAINEREADRIKKRWESNYFDFDKDNFPWANIAQTALNIGGDIYNKATNKFEAPVKYANPQNFLRQYDPTAALRQNNRSAALNQYLMKQNSGGNAQAYMASRAQAGANEGQAGANIIAQYDQMNIKPFNDLAVPAATWQNQGMIDTAKNEANTRNIDREATGQISNKLAKGIQDYSKGKSQDQIVSMMKTGRFEWTKNKDGSFAMTPIKTTQTTVPKSFDAASLPSLKPWKLKK